MTIQTTKTNTLSRKARGTAAVFLGFAVTTALFMGADQLLRSLQIYPAWGQPMFDPSLNLLALAYRSLFGVLGSYIAASLAPENPMSHAMVPGWISLQLNVLGAIAMIAFVHSAPNWYAIGLVLIALPSARLGGLLHRQNQPQLAYDTPQYGDQLA